ncbi:MAG: hypothetical protein CTY19_02870 [Methylomonas sp.]|nr:MAG: hypothetical protein CTY19_02870 [Methylomonas sp.]
MLHIKPKEMRSAVCLCVLSMLLTPTLTQAETSMLLAEAETGSTAARQAAEQKEALAKKAAERAAKKAAEASKAAESNAPNTATVTADEPKEK